MRAAARGLDISCTRWSSIVNTSQSTSTLILNPRCTCAHQFDPMSTESRLKCIARLPILRARFMRDMTTGALFIDMIRVLWFGCLATIIKGRRSTMSGWIQHTLMNEAFCTSHAAYTTNSLTLRPASEGRVAPIANNRQRLFRCLMIHVSGSWSWQDQKPGLGQGSVPQQDAQGICVKTPWTGF